MQDEIMFWWSFRGKPIKSPSYDINKTDAISCLSHNRDENHFADLKISLSGILMQHIT